MAPETARLRRIDDERVPPLARRFGDALRAADGAAADAVVGEALAGGFSPVLVQALILEPAMQRIGQLWEVGAITVADEHLASAITERVMVRLFETLAVTPSRSREKVLLAAVEGQHHVLGLRMVADVLEGAGFDVLYLGADVPVGDLAAFAARHQPAIAGLSYGIASDVTALADAICALSEAAPAARLLLGGRAIPPGLRTAGYPWVESSIEVLYWAERVLAEPPRAVPEAIRLLRSTQRPRPWPRRAAVDSDPVSERLAETASQTSEVAREYVRQAAAYRDMAYRDPLTELGNRRAFEDRLPGEVAGSSAWLLMIDVDEFKAINDAHGHDAGDQILRLVADVIKHNVRQGDFAARVGGDEFAVIVRRATAEGAERVARRILSQVREAADPPVTISMGLSRLGADARGSLLAADSALYDAKIRGRNCVAGSRGSR